MTKKHFVFILIVSTVACTVRQVPNEAPKKTTLAEVIKKQVLLTNHADFTTDRTLIGASAFLIYYNDTVYAVTAKHLIGPDGGVEPAVPLKSLAVQLINWKMYPRQPIHPATDTITATANGLDYNLSTSDALLLKTVAFKQGIQPLKPNFDYPVKGDLLYVIGCPYAESNCKQNVYKMVFQEISEHGMLICELFSSVEMRGFSGAPVVNINGEVVGIIMGSGDADGKHYVSATSIKEIKWVR